MKKSHDFNIVAAPEAVEMALQLEYIENMIDSPEMADKPFDHGQYIEWVRQKCEKDKGLELLVWVFLDGDGLVQGYKMLHSGIRLGRVELILAGIRIMLRWAAVRNMRFYVPDSIRFLIDMVARRAAAILFTAACPSAAPPLVRISMYTCVRLSTHAIVRLSAIGASVAQFDAVVVRATTAAQKWFERQC